MSIDKKIKNILNKYNPFNITIKSASDLVTDLGMDSLSFIMFLDEVESVFNIAFEINEISKCLKLNSLIKLVESKIKGKD